MKPIRILEVKSELGAGTRGASLGVDALKVACLNSGSDFFARYALVEVLTENEALFQHTPYRKAKYIDIIYEVSERVCNLTYETLKYGSYPIVLAGDHSTAAGTIAGVKKAYPDQRLGVIWIDAHADLHSPFTTPSGNMHGMPLAISLAEDNLDCKINRLHPETAAYWHQIKNLGGVIPKIKHEDIVFVSMRDTEEEEIHLIDKYQIKNFTVSELRKIGIEEVVTRTFKHLADCDLIYISFDVDSLDARISQGTGTPVKNGLSVDEARELNSLLIQHPKVCCWEMVEVNPCLDKTGNVMAENAFSILESVVDTLERVQKKSKVLN